MVLFVRAVVDPAVLTVGFVRPAGDPAKSWLYIWL
jgi:hypothetical protein